jgi:hypothetical protein
MVTPEPGDAIQRAGPHVNRSKLRKGRRRLVQRGVKRRAGERTRQRQHDALCPAALSQVVVNERCRRCDHDGRLRDVSCKGPYDPRMAEQLPTPAADVVFRELNGEIVLVHLGTDRIYALNETGARFWELLVTRADLGTIRSRLLAEFEISPADLDREISALLDELHREGLVT